MVDRLIRATLYFAYSVIAAYGLFLLRIDVNPYIFGKFVLPYIPAGARVSPIFLVSIFSLPSAIPAGLIFGLVLGLLIASRPGYKAFLVAGCSIILLLIFALLSLGFEDTMAKKFYWWTLVVEALVFVSVFVLSAIVVSRLAVNVYARVRKIAGVMVLLIFFVAFYGIHGI